MKYVPNNKLISLSYNGNAMYYKAIIITLYSYYMRISEYQISRLATSLSARQNYNVGRYIIYKVLKMYCAV